MENQDKQSHLIWYREYQNIVNEEEYHYARWVNPINGVLNFYNDLLKGIEVDWSQTEICTFSDVLGLVPGNLYLRTGMVDEKIKIIDLGEKTHESNN